VEGCSRDPRVIIRSIGLVEGMDQRPYYGFDGCLNDESHCTLSLSLSLSLSEASEKNYHHPFKKTLLSIIARGGN